MTVSLPGMLRNLLNQYRKAGTVSLLPFHAQDSASSLIGEVSVILMEVTGSIVDRLDSVLSEPCRER